MGGQNTGSSDSTIEQIQINGIPYQVQTVSGTSSLSYQVPAATITTSNNKTASVGSTLSVAVPSGQSFAIQLVIKAGGSPYVPGAAFTDGQTIQVAIITAAGNNYPASIVLP
ncbi:MAG: hypothetical protein QXG05_05680 [Nitrososphaerota archaeon]